MDSDLLKIYYGGNLGYLNSKNNNWFSKWFWTYNYEYIDYSTRSGYYIIHAVNYLKNNRNILPSQLKFCFWGKIHPKNIELVNELNLQDFFSFSGYISKDQSLKKLLNADVLLLPLEKSVSSKHNNLFIPGKLYEYLKIKKPILALTNSSDCYELVKRSNLGIFSSPDNILEIADVIYNLIINKKRLTEINPDLNYIKSFSSEILCQKLSKIFDELLLNGY
tara:strand:+ start:341 stop:1003 length:663 start_codon:yes stop_codon:yes gene_type:complete